ncbi:hypothetical protein ABIE67_000574 [Streptomyces sp. V4I8]
MEGRRSESAASELGRVQFEPERSGQGHGQPELVPGTLGVGVAGRLGVNRHLALLAVDQEVDRAAGAGIAVHAWQGHKGDRKYHYREWSDSTLRRIVILNR